MATGRPGGGNPLTVHVLGRQRHLEQALVTFFAHAPPEVAMRFDGSLPGLLARRAQAVAQASLAAVRLVDLVPGLATGLDGHLVVAPYLRARLALSGSVDAWLDQVRSRQLRSRLRRLHREDGAVTVTRDPADLDRFYRELYVPQAVCRFGTRAHLEPEAELMRLVSRRGALLLVHRRGRMVGGALVYTPRSEPGVLTWAKLGLTDSDTLSASERGEATAALELAVVGHALQTGHAAVDLGLCSASLEDGVLIHKLRLGADSRALPRPASPRPGPRRCRRAGGGAGSALRGGARRPAGGDGGLRAGGVAAGAEPVRGVAAGSDLPRAGCGGDPGAGGAGQSRPRRGRRRAPRGRGAGGPDNRGSMSRGPSASFFASRLVRHPARRAQGVRVGVAIGLPLASMGHFCGW